ncbi:hypothetical protein YC2023_026916 [Brassica napus]
MDPHHTVGAAAADNVNFFMGRVVDNLDTICAEVKSTSLSSVAKHCISPGHASSDATSEIEAFSRCHVGSAPYH